MSKFEEAKQFWDVIAEPLKLEDVVEGQPFLLDDTVRGIMRTVIVTKVDTDDAGNRQITFRDALPGEITETPTDYLIGGARS